MTSSVPIPYMSGFPSHFLLILGIRDGCPLICKTIHPASRFQNSRYIDGETIARLQAADSSSVETDSAKYPHGQQSEINRKLRAQQGMNRRTGSPEHR
jgi:hypothetical protein